MPTETFCSDTWQAAVFDTETCDIKNPIIIEAAMIPLDLESLSPICAPIVQTFNPGPHKITYGAMATHHILPFDLQNEPLFDTIELPTSLRYLIGHNVTFDVQALEHSNPTCAVHLKTLRCIDTLTLARKAWPDLGSYTQSAILYALAHNDALQRFPDDPERQRTLLIEARNQARFSHSAAADTLICYDIFSELLRMPSLQRDIDVTREVFCDQDLSVLDALHLISESARIPLTMPFGKHQGQAPWTLPASYINWYMGCEDPDPWIVLSMLKGANDNPKLTQYFDLAVRLSQTAEPAPSKNQPTRVLFKP